MLVSKTNKRIFISSCISHKKAGTKIKDCMKGGKMRTCKKIFVKRKECELFDQIIHSFPGPLFIYDTETTGVNTKTAHIIQISAIRLERGENGQYRIADYLNEYIKPPEPVPEKASTINNITNEFLEDKKTGPEIFPMIQNFFKEAEQGNGVVIGYNNKKFDDHLLKKFYQENSNLEFRPAYSVDCRIIAEEVVRKSDLPDQSVTLANVADLYGVLENGMHDSMTDTKVTGRLLFRLFEDYLDHFKEQNTGSKPRICITGMYRFKKSKTVNYIIISGNIRLPDGHFEFGKIRYDIWNKCYEQEEGNLLEIGDFDAFVKDANQFAGGDIAKYK